MRLRHLILLTMIILTLPACSATRSIQQDLQADLASQPTFIVDEWVKRMPPAVQVHPSTTFEKPLSVLFLPFRVTQTMDNPQELGYGVAATVWQNWLANKTFSTIEFYRDAGPYRRDIALMLGRQRGADLVVGGFVTHFFAGGQNADSTVAMIVEIYDVRNGQLIWLLAQTGVISKQSYSDFLIFGVKSRLPTDPTSYIVNIMAKDMSDLIKEWQGQPIPKDDSIFNDTKPFTGSQPVMRPNYDGNNGVPANNSRSHSAF